MASKVTINLVGAKCPEPAVKKNNKGSINNVLRNNTRNTNGLTRMPNANNIMNKTTKRPTRTIRKRRNKRKHNKNNNKKKIDLKSLFITVVAQI